MDNKEWIETLYQDENALKVKDNFDLITEDYQLDLDTIFGITRDDLFDDIEKEGHTSSIRSQTYAIAHLQMKYWNKIAIDIKDNTLKYIDEDLREQNFNSWKEPEKRKEVLLKLKEKILECENTEFDTNY